MDYNEDSDTAEEVATRNRPAPRDAIVDGEQENEEEEEEGDEEEEEEPTVSVSSRGRVRKIIAKARRIFRD